jgi:thiamine-phosphate pyrophosphorylase
MISSASSCSTWRLYAVIDASACGARDVGEVAAAAIRGGADVIQLRHKTATTRALLPLARRLVAVTGAAGVPLIINDRVDVTALTDAAGVHLGQDDTPVAEARRQLGPRCLIGKSAHTLEQALAAQAEGADYIGVGPVFATPTKPDYPPVGLALVRQVQAAGLRVPAVCIGGIDASNAAEVVRAGGSCLAVVRAICVSPDPESAARTLKRLIVDSVQASYNTGSVCG